MVAAAGACASGTETTTGPVGDTTARGAPVSVTEAPAPREEAEDSPAPAPAADPTVTTTARPAPLVGPELLRSGDPAVVFATRAAPANVRIPAIGVDAAVVAVGVDAAGVLEVPGRTDVGWYAFGPRPADEGAAVLAGHVDFDGLPGVFFRLTDLSRGTEVVVGFEDGSTQRFAVEDVTRYGKSALPAEVVWRREGEPALVLITCGGAFNPGLGSYEDNVVVVARPR